MRQRWFSRGHTYQVDPTGSGLACDFCWSVRAKVMVDEVTGESAWELIGMLERETAGTLEETQMVAVARRRRAARR